MILLDMKPALPILLSLLAWPALWTFWFITTRVYHPTTVLAIVVTTSLVGACIVSVYTNHLCLIPRLWERKSYLRYWACLIGTIAGSAAVSLVVIRISYFRIMGPDPDPYGALRHFAIDFAGIAVHVAAVALFVCLWKRLVGFEVQRHERRAQNG